MSKRRESDRKRSRPVIKKKKSDVIKKNKIASILIILLLLVSAIAGAYLVLTSNEEEEGRTIAIIDTSMGTIKVELYVDDVPDTCENFIKLADDGFYDGLVFHRVANIDPSQPDTHVVQGGGFESDGTQKNSPYGTINLEINEERSHVDGAIAMARTPDPNSATSQFYICDGAHHSLDDWVRQEQYGDRGYAVFGKVFEVMNVVRLIADVITTTKYGMSNWPIDDVVIDSITIERQ
jgi:peptidyl-prolyl cis-trans isomerase B (cyclophilin B)